MIIRDLFGNPLTDGQQVAVSLGLGVTVAGQLHFQTISLGPQDQPMAFVTVTIPMGINPVNGVVPGVTAIKTAPEQSALVQE